MFTTEGLHPKLYVAGNTPNSDLRALKTTRDILWNGAFKGVYALKVI